MSSTLRPHLAALCIAVSAALCPPAASAQSRAASPARRIGRLAVAARQGSTDEVVLPVTELRARRVSAAERRAERERPVRLCLRPPVEIRRLRSRDAPRWVGSLTDCAGRPTLRAMAALALLAQPQRTIAMNLPAAMTELRRVAPAAGLSLADDVAPSRPRRRATSAPGAPASVPRDPHTHDPVVEVAPGARALHPRIVQHLQAVVEHFPGHVVEIVSGYRPGTSASRHAHARALDLRLVGVRHEALRDFARTLRGAGVGFYPNSVFIHLDVRDEDEGSAYWTDYSGPGETPRYGHWPPTDQDIRNEVGWMVRATGAHTSERDAARPPADTARPATESATDNASESAPADLADDL